MQPLLHDKTEKMLDWFMGVEFRDLPERDRPVNQQVQMLCSEREQRYPRDIESEKRNQDYETVHGWRQEGFTKDDRRVSRRGIDRDEVNPDIVHTDELTDVSEILYQDTTRRPRIDDDLRDRLEEIVAEEYRAVPVEELSFDELLAMALEAWNVYAQAVGVGWFPLRENG